MCLKFFFYSNKPEKKNFVIINDDMEEDFKKTSPLKNINSYYSPNCTKRPLRAQRKCMNCESIFYDYNKINFCSKECSLSYMYRDEEF
jgi:hypothetical protein